MEPLVCLLLIAIGVAVLMLPVCRFVIIGWRAKRKDIMDGLDADARVAYFEMFNRSESPQPPANASIEFEKLYTKWYGRRFFITPSILLFLSGALTVTLIVLSSLDRLHYISNPFFNLPDTAMAAIAGAYLWVGNDFISRARRLDFSSADVLWGVLRLVIAIPMGYAFAAIAADSVGPFIAFAIGAFPLSALISMLKRLSDKKLGLEATAEEASDDIAKLQGINRTIVERLANEDVTTITQLAYCDPVRLTMRSNLSFNFITDCMNQALAWMYLQGDLQTIRPLGMRGAVEIKHLIEDLDGVVGSAGGPKALERAQAAFPLIAAAIKQDRATLELVFRQIAEDPYTGFLYGVWT